MLWESRKEVTDMGGLNIRHWLILAILLFLNVAILGCLFLMVAEKVVP